MTVETKFHYALVEGDLSIRSSPNEICTFEFTCRRSQTVYTRTYDNLSISEMNVRYPSICAVLLPTHIADPPRITVTDNTVTLVWQTMIGKKKEQLTATLLPKDEAAEPERTIRLQQQVRSQAIRIADLEKIVNLIWQGATIDTNGYRRHEFDIPLFHNLETRDRTQTALEEEALWCIRHMRLPECEGCTATAPSATCPYEKNMAEWDRQCCEKISLLQRYGLKLAPKILWAAACKSKILTVKLILDAGVNPHVKDDSCNSPFDKLTTHIEMFKTLPSSGSWDGRHRSAESGGLAAVMLMFTQWRDRTPSLTCE